VLLVATCSIRAAQAQAESPFDRVALAAATTQRIFIDGYLDEPAWQAAEPLSGFTLLHTNPPALAREQTVARLLFDKQRIYVGVECQDPNVSLLLAQKWPRDGPVYGDDAVEVHFDPHQEHAGYFQVIVNARGSLYDAIELDESWNGDVRAKARVYERGWTLEFSLTFASLNVQTPREGDLWGFDLFRNKRSAGVNAKSCWTNTGDAFDRPERYGHLVFGSYRPLIFGRLAVVEANLAQTERELQPTPAGEEKASYQARLAELRDRVQALRASLAPSRSEGLTDSGPPGQVWRDAYYSVAALLDLADELRWAVKFFALLTT